MQSLDTFTRAYIEAMLWSSHVDDDDSFADANYDVKDFAPATLARIIADCEAFQISNVDLIDGGGIDRMSQRAAAGHDFWLTRAGHGAGFWDGDWNEPAATKLTDACKAFGNLDLYVGDYGKLYF